MEKFSFKRFLSLAMAIVMVLSYVPAPAYATEVVACSNEAHTVSVVGATCTTDGSYAITCPDCGDSTEVIPATGHNYVDGMCEYCGESDPAAPASEPSSEATEPSSEATEPPKHEHSYEAVVTAPTCTEDGYTTYTCACEDSYTADEVAALGHSFAEGVCSVCEAEDPDYVTPSVSTEPAHEHSYNAVVTAPTCTEAGYTTYTCACGDSYVADETKVIDHAYEFVVTEPTCTAMGYTTYTCSMCGDWGTYQEVPALEHNTDGENGTCTMCRQEPVMAVADTDVAKIGDQGYATLQAAIDAAEAGDTITLTDNVTENVTVNKAVTIDGAGNTYTGTMTLSKGFDVAIKNCNFDGENGKYPYALSSKGANSLTVTDCVAKNFTYGFLYVSSGMSSVAVKNVTVENCPNYAVYFGSGVNNATFTNLTVKNSNNGILLNNTAKRSLTISGCKMENVSTAINHSRGTYTITCNVKGENDFGAAASSEYVKFVLDEGAVIIRAVAKIGTQGYETVAAAFAAATNGDTVELIADTYEDLVIPAEFGGTLAIGTCKLNSITNNSATAKIVINGNVVVENANGSAITGEVINISGNGTLTAIANGDHAYGIGGDNTKSITIENVHILKVQGGHYGRIGSDTKYYKDAPEGGAAIGSGSNGAVITLTNVTIDKALGGSKAAGIGALYHTGVTVNITDCKIDYVEGGATAAGIGGSRVSKGATASEAVTIKIQNSTITAVGGVFAAGIGSGYDTHCQANQPICTINIDGSTIKATGGKYAAGIGTGYHNAGLAGEIKNSTVTAVSGEKVYKDEYTSAQDIGFGVADLAREGSNNDSYVIYNGTKIALPGNVAQIGTQGYKTVEEAFAAAKADETVELIADTYEDIVIPAEFGGTLAIGTATLNSITNNSATAKIVINGNVVVENANGSAFTGEVINISGNGTLTAIANGDHAYGIGGDSTKSITIENVHILKAQGGHYGEIGTDTKYYKDAPEGGAAIGSGSNGAVITLTNVTIDKALGGSKAAGIGALYHTGVTVNITGCEIAYVEGGATAAGIGGSRVSEGATEAENVTINIQNSTITAVGGVFAAGIGSGYDTHCQANQPICTINIDGSTINATGGQYAAGIGTGYHNAGLAGEIKNSTVTAVSGEKVYKDKYTSAQDIGFGVADLEREGSNNDSYVIYNGTKIALPGNVAQIGETKYKTLADAMAAAKADDTITLLADNADSVEVGVNVTIDLNGNSYTGTITLTSKEVTVTAPEGLDVVTSATNYVVKYETGKYVQILGGTWGGIDWTLSADGTLTIAPTKGEPVPDKNAPTKRTYEVGEWRETVIYKSNGSASKIGGAPYDMNAVKKLIIEEGVTTIGSFTAQFPNLTGEVVIPSTVTYIGQEAFHKTPITKLTFAAGGTEILCIANGAFKKTLIEEVSFPGDRAEIHIHHWAFGGSTNLKSAYIPANITKTWGGEHVDYFDNYNSQTNVTWAEYGSMFTGCTAMETITFENEDARDLFFEKGRQSTAEDYIVAYVGLTAYNSVAAAIAKAEAGETVVLLKNVTLSDSLVINKSIKLDLNGKTVSGTFKLAENATLTAPEGLNVVSSDAEKYEVEYNDGVYSLATAVRVAQIGETKYKTLAAALEAAKAGDKIELIDNVTEDVTVSKDVTIDGAGKTYTGTMTVNAGLTVTVENVNFVNGGISKGSKSSTGNYTIKNCTFDGEGKYAYPLSFKGAKTITVEGCTVKNYMYSFLYVSSAAINASVKNVTVENCPNYAVYFASGVNTAVIENLTVKNSGSGFIINNSANRTFTIKNCKLENVETAIKHNGGTNTITCTVLGENDFGTAATSEYAKYVLGESGATLTAVENLDVTTSVEGREVEYTDGVYNVVEIVRVAQIGETKYKTLAAALAVAEAGDKIELIDNVTEDVTVSKNVTIDGAGKTYTGTMTVNAGLTVTVENVNFVNGGISKGSKTSTGNYTIKNCTFDGEGKYAYPLSFKGAKTITVEGCTVKNYMYSFLYVSSAAINASVKNVTVENCPNYAVYFASGVNTAVIENLTVKNSNNGFIINNTANRTFTIKNCKLENVETAIKHNSGTNTITCTVLGENDFGTAATSEYAKYVLGESGATLTAVENLDVTTSVEGREVEYTDGVYNVVEIVRVAKIGETQYKTLAAAIAAAGDNDTITLLSDINLADAEPVELDGSYNTYFKVEGKTVTIDMNGKSITGAYAEETMLVGVFSTDNNGHLTLTGNGTVNVTSNGKVYALIANYEPGCTITIENGNYTLNSALDSLVYTGGNEGVIVKGGTFELGNVGTGKNGKPWIFNTHGNGENHVHVVGGTYNANIFKQYWTHEVQCPADQIKAIQDNGNGTWTVVDAAAYIKEQIGNYGYNRGYITLADAVAALKDGETITLLADNAEDVEIKDNATINLNGNAFTGSITLTDAAATLTAPEGLNVTTNVADKKVAYDEENGVYKLVNKAVKVNVTIEDAEMVAGNALPEFTYKTDVVIDDASELKFTYTIMNGEEEADITVPGEYTVITTVDAVEGYEFSIEPSKLTVKEALAAIGEGEKAVYYASLAEAVEEAADGDTIILQKSCEGAGVVIDKSITIDFAQNTYTVTSGVGSAGTESNGFQILKGNTVVVKNGKMNVAESAASTMAMLIQNYADLTVTDMKLIGENLNKSADGYSYVLSNNSGNVVINGATSIVANSKGENAFAFDVCKYADYEAPVVSVATTGTIDGKIEVTKEIEDNLTISSGTFTVRVSSEWCADGYLPVFADAKNKTTWTVKKATAVATIGNEKYAKIQHAINDAKSGDEIDLVANVENQPVYVNVAVTLDLNGYSYTHNQNKQVIVYTKDGKLNYLNPNASTSDTKGMINVMGGGLTVKDSVGTGMIESTVGNIFSIAKTLTIENGIFKVGTVAKDGKPAVIVASKNNYTYGTELNIISGEFYTAEGGKPFNMGFAAGNSNDKISIEKAWFSEDIQETWINAKNAKGFSYCQSAAKSTEGTDGYLVTVGVMTVDGMWFKSWDEAKSSIKKNSVIVLYDDVANTYNGGGVAKDYKFPASAGTITLDLNGHTFTSSKAGGNITTISVQSNTTLVIKDSVGGGKVTFENGASYPMVMANNATVKFMDSVSFNGSFQFNGGGNLYIGESDKALIGKNGIYQINGTTRVVVSENGDWTLSLGSLKMTADDATLENNTLTVNKDRVLDLNGHNLVANNITVFGNLIDSTDGTGSVKSEKLWFNGHNNGSYLPLKDGDCYRLFATILDNRGVKPDTGNAIKVGFTVRFNKEDAYNLLIKAVKDGAITTTAFFVESGDEDVKAFTATAIINHLNTARDQLVKNGVVTTGMTGKLILLESATEIFAELSSDADTNVVIRSNTVVYTKP